MLEFYAADRPTSKKNFPRVADLDSSGEQLRHSVDIDGPRREKTFDGLARVPEPD